MGVAGAALGFLLVLFIADTIPAIVAAIVLMIAGSLYVQYEKRRRRAGSAPSGGLTGGDRRTL